MTSILTCKSSDSASLKQPRAGVSPVVLEVEVLDLAVATVFRLASVEGVPPDPHTDVSGHDEVTSSLSHPNTGPCFKLSLSLKDSVNVNNFL